MLLHICLSRQSRTPSPARVVTWDPGAAVRRGGAVKELRVMQICKKQKSLPIICACFCSATGSISKIINVIKIHSEFSGARQAAINLFRVDLHKPWNDDWYCYEKAPLPCCPVYERAGGQWPPSFPRSPASLFATGFPGSLPVSLQLASVPILTPHACFLLW